MALYNYDYDGSDLEGVPFDTWIYKSFLPDINYKITSIKLQGYYLSLGGSPLSLTFQIKEVATGIVVCSGSALTSDFPFMVADWVEITLGAGADLRDTANYYIMVYQTSGLPWDDYLVLVCDGPVSDFQYECWGTATPPGKAVNPTPADDEEDVAKGLTKLEWDSP